MLLPSSDPQTIATLIADISARLQPLQQSPTQAEQAGQTLTSLQQLRDIILGYTDRAEALNPAEMTELGNFGLQLLGNSADLIQRLNDPELQQQNGLLAVCLSLWVAEHAGEISMLEPVVNTLAWLANRLQEPEALARLAEILGTIIAACDADIRSDVDNSNPGRPWRMINLNRGIVATRSLDPVAMEAAFQSLIQNLPEDAGSFFAEGMSEMDRLGYPDAVRAVMQRYFDQWNRGPALH